MYLIYTFYYNNSKTHHFQSGFSVVDKSGDDSFIGISERKYCPFKKYTWYSMLPNASDEYSKEKCIRVTGFTRYSTCTNKA